VAVATPIARPPLWRNVRFLRVLGQAAFLVAVVLVAREALLNLRFGVQEQNVDLSFDFLRQRAGFEIGEGIAFSPNQSYLDAFRVAVLNTIRVALIGIVLATLLGLIMGVARLSTNWLVRRVAQVYVEVVRNIPVLVQIIFWYVAVILALPVIGGGVSVGGVAFISNRGTAVPWFGLEPGAGALAVLLLVGVAAGWAVARWRRAVGDRTGRPARRGPWAIGTFALVAAVGFVATGMPVSLDVPQVGRFGYRGGLRVSPEYTALLLGLVIYTGAFIAEIVRGSILAVPKGQKEAAEALGFTPRQQLRFVVLPQALRIAIPPLNSQYLNLTKNSSLGLAVAYPEIVAVSSTIINQAARATQVLLLMMATYLAMSLIISGTMNALNRAVVRRGER
jgi:general L-amino acid transport system permease protein